jgi:hypothetical protein
VSTSLFPQAQEPEQSTWGRFKRLWLECTGCTQESEIVGYWGEHQELKYCASCDEIAWRNLVLALEGG